MLLVRYQLVCLQQTDIQALCKYHHLQQGHINNFTISVYSQQIHLQLLFYFSQGPVPATLGIFTEYLLGTYSPSLDTHLYILRGNMCSQSSSHVFGAERKPQNSEETHKDTCESMKVHTHIDTQKPQLRIEDPRSVRQQFNPLHHLHYIMCCYLWKLNVFNFPCRVCSCPVPSVPGIGSRFTLTRIKQLWQMSEFIL